MPWYQRSGPGKDVFVSTRVRLARNVAGYPFGARLTDSAAKELIERVTALFPEKEGYVTTDMQTLSPAQAGALCEKHYISPEFAEKREPHALIVEESKGLSVMVCEEDHLRIQALAAGFAPEECLRNAIEAEERVDDALELAFDEKLGYLTHCPTNLGTGMRLSVMMFLPALTMAGRMPSLSAQLQKLGLVIRGMQGEGSDTAGYLYQISNQFTLGLSEEETVKKVSDIVRRLAENERSLRRGYDKVTRLRLADRAGRAEGTMRFARLLSSADFLDAWAALRLGVCLGENASISAEELDTMIFEVMPASVTLALTDETAGLSPELRRDATRAKEVARRFADKNPQRGDDR